MPAPNGQGVRPPTAPQPPRLFVNVNGSGSRFYYYDSNTTIGYFDPVTQRYGTFMPPIYEKQTYLCNDGTSFVFSPDGSGSYTNCAGTLTISPGRYPWMPPEPVVVTIPVPAAVQSPLTRQRVPQTEQDEEEDSSDEGEIHRRWKLGLA